MLREALSSSGMTLGKQVRFEFITPALTDSPLNSQA